MKTISNITYFAFAALTVACFVFSPQSRAACQQGCLPNANTALGEDALVNNTGSDNTAIGFNALSSNTTGGDNVAAGDFALFNNTNGGFNTATGHNALFANTEGSFNTASGDFALSSNTSGTANSAVGDSALQFNTIGFNNTAIGTGALRSDTTGNSNVALGFEAGVNVTGNSNIDIGNIGIAGESRTIRVGTRQTHRNIFIAGISGVTVPTGVAVIVDANGHLGTTTSSASFKENIEAMDKTSEAILALKPVTFRYKRDLDQDSIPQFGLVAEEVEKVSPDLVARDEQGRPYTVRYEAVNAMLLNEFLKEHRRNEVQESKIARLEEQIEALTAGLQRVNAQLELRKSTSQTVLISR